VVRLSIERPGAATTDWLAGLDGASVTRAGGDAIEVAIPAPDDPGGILATALGHGALVTRYEIDDPSVEELFVQLVGRSPEDEPEPVARAPADGASFVIGDVAS
jgi:hypothetical protein